MVFFISKENKKVTTLVGAVGLIGLTIGIAASLLLYKFTYGHPELRIPSMAIVLFLGLYASRTLVIGPLGFLLGFVIAVTQSIGDLPPSPEKLVREILWIWVAVAYAVGLDRRPQPAFFYRSQRARPGTFPNRKACSCRTRSQIRPMCDSRSRSRSRQ
jgi:hypothetical protein